jgi:putative peptide zinc metalloprotease protein
MTEPARSGPARPGEAVARLLRPSGGLRLLGEYQGSGFTEPRFLVRRGDGQVIQLSRLLYLVMAAIAEGDADGGWDAGRVAAHVRTGFGREVTADNVRYLVTVKLVALGVVMAGEPGPGPEPATPAGGAGANTPGHAPRTDVLLGLKIRGTLLRPRAAGAAGRALAWLHDPVLAAAVVAGFAAFETWLFAGHGAIGPLLDVLHQPVLFLAVAGLTLASLLFHELGHASACRYGGARPGAIGFGLYLIWPSLYTDVTDVYRLGRAGRLRTDLGGVYFNAIFILALGGCYAATGQPVFLAAAFADNFQVLQQLAPLVRMDGYFILGDLAGVPDLLGLVIPIMVSLLPASLRRRPAARRAASRASGLRRSPRLLVSAWVLVAIPLLAAAAGYTLWHLPAIVTTAARSFTSGLTTARAGFSAGRPAAGLTAALNLVLLVIPVAGLIYLLARIARRGARAAARLADWRQASHGQRYAIALSALCAMAAGAGATLALGVAVVGAGNRAPAAVVSQAAADRARAAVWIAGQVSQDVTVACDAQMCGQIRGRGVPAAMLRTVQPPASRPFGSGLVVATPAVRARFGSRLAAVYAPLVIASFGTGAGRVDVRLVAPAGAAAFTSRLASGRAAVISAARQLLGNRNLEVSAQARTVMLAGHVDSRLLVTLSVLASQMPVRLVALGDLPPGASPAVPLRGADIGAASPRALAAALAFLRAQQPPYRPGAAAVVPGAGGRSLVAVRFDVPSPIGAGYP